MKTYVVRTHTSAERLARRDELAWHLAELAARCPQPAEDVADMVINRMIDNAGVASAALARSSVSAARDMALSHASANGALVLGVEHARVSPEWAAWANGVAVRELDFHDTYLAAEYAHPGDNIPALLALAQHLGQRGVSGADLVRGIALAYEVQIDLARSVSLHAFRIDHVAHLGPSIAAGIGSMLGLDVEVIYHAISQALHTTTATRQSRKGEISTWKAYAPAFAGKVAIEAIDRALRAQTSPAPIYEGEDGVIAVLLGGPEATYDVTLPEPGEDARAILDSFTKEYSAEYQAQAWIDLARRLRVEDPRLMNAGEIEEIVLHTSHHTHQVIGSGANDPQKYDPWASRETLDHSVAYILAVALQDGRWHHEDSYAPERARRSDTVALWKKIRTVEDPQWSQRYLAEDPALRAFGGRLVARFRDGSRLEAEIVVPDAHPMGARPFSRAQYLEKFRSLATPNLDEGEAERFLEQVSRLGQLKAGELDALNVSASGLLADVTPTEGIL